ncbi:MAG: cytidylate kinase-like family protein [Ruminococcaceae bacterium]|nr:cytidylate kinase-like family protein [Oscillospiraceae bacterium]
MKTQIIFSIGREFGSAGHHIAGKLAERLGIALYDKRFFIECHDQIGFSAEIMEKYDEKARNILTSKKIRNHTNSIEAHVQDKVTDFILKRAESGESFVIVGRCSDEILRNNHNTAKIFITGHIEEKIERVMDVYSLSREAAIDKIKRHDKKRRNYHNSYSEMKWGDSRGYDLCIDTSVIGIDAAVDLLCQYAESFKKAKDVK